MTPAKRARPVRARVAAGVAPTLPGRVIGLQGPTSCPLEASGSVTVPCQAVVSYPDGCLRLVLHEPPSANRWWRHVGGRVLLSREAREYKASVERLLGYHRVQPLDGPVRVTVVWRRGRRAGDLDKRLGVLLDALQGTAYHNDGQIVAIRAERRDAPGNAGVTVEVEPFHPQPPAP